MPTKIANPPPGTTGYLVQFTTEEGWPIVEVHISLPCPLRELEKRAEELLKECLIKL